MNKHTFVVSSVILVAISVTSQAEGERVRFKIVGSEPPAERYRVCRQMLVGPWHNQPEEYEGYNGFVGWAGVTRLRSGRWFVTFTSGLWHCTFPWSAEIREDPVAFDTFKEWHEIGLPNYPAPRGGRAHIMSSDDEAKTWSRPETLIDTVRDDRHPTILELDDGTLLCCMGEVALPRGSPLPVHAIRQRWSDVVPADGSRSLDADGPRQRAGNSA